jgi:hypothetical protein
MSTSARESSAPLHDEAALAMATMRPVAEVARDLGIRTEVEFPRLPGIVDWARFLAEAVGVTATIVMDADGICVRFTP